MKSIAILASCLMLNTAAASAQDRTPRPRPSDDKTVEFLKQQLVRTAERIREVEAQSQKFRVASGNSQGFSVILATGDLQGGTPARDLPPAASKALADMSQFLPYKSYELLDAQWILGSPRSTARLRGPDNREYELELRTVPRPDQSVRIDFNLRDPQSPFAAVAPARTAAPNRPAAVRILRQSGRIIDTTFNMDVGETVVVGTSRLQGDKALIVLLTAVGR
jgi:hypothetical protein